MERLDYCRHEAIQIWHRYFDWIWCILLARRARRLYVITYLSTPNAGAGTGLYAIDQNMQVELLASHNVR